MKRNEEEMKRNRWGGPARGPKISLGGPFFYDIIMGMELVGGGGAH